MFKTVCRHVDVQLHAGTLTSRVLKVIVYRFNSNNSLVHSKTYYPASNSMRRLFKVLHLQSDICRPENIRLEAGYGSLQHLAVDVIVDGPIA